MNRVAIIGYTYSIPKTQKNSLFIFHVCLQNNSIIGVHNPMGFLDFAPEPPAPTATPVSVSEHIDLNHQTNDTRDLSSKYYITNR